MKQEIEGLRTGKRSGRPGDRALQQVNGARAELAALTQRYKKDHPDVVQAKKSVTALEQELRRVSRQSGGRSAVEPGKPRLYQQHSVPLSSTVASLQSLKATRQQTQRRADGIAKRLEQRRKSSRNIRSDERTGQCHAEVSRDPLPSVEARYQKDWRHNKKVRRFSLIDPPGLPEKPEKPNRACGFFLGFIVAMVRAVRRAAAGIWIARFEPPIN